METEKNLRRLVILALLYLIPSVQAMLPIEDPDIWWHLRTGQWILEHSTVPTEDPFSAYGMGRPWIAYSWLFDILVYGLYTEVGLLGLVLFTVLISLAIALALHFLVLRAGFPFFAEVAITAVGLFCFKPNLSPRPWLFTILFFILELHILFAALKSGNSRKLFFLPPLFLLWANLHIQFIYGLAVLLVAVAEPYIHKIVRRVWNIGQTKFIPQGYLLIITLLSIAATFVTPYYIHLFEPIWEYTAQTRVFNYISEHHPMFFRSPTDWFVLTLTLGATFVLGRIRETKLFPFLLLVMGAFLSFRARRDAWFIVVAAVSIITEWQPSGIVSDRMQLTKGKVVFVAGAITISLFAFGHFRNISEPSLREHVGKIFPADAVGFIRQNGYSGPLYNHLDWGGYLIWMLPSLPVSMDGRTNLHGEDRIERSLATWGGFMGWDSDPELVNARLVIAGIRRPLTSLLRADSHFKLVYEDSIAAVFVAEPTNPLKN